MKNINNLTLTELSDEEITEQIIARLNNKNSQTRVLQLVVASELTAEAEEKLKELKQKIKTKEFKIDLE